MLAWDGDGRLFAGSESSDDPAGSPKTFGDVWVATYENPAGAGGATINDGKEFRRSVIVATGASAPNLLGKFHDKTAIAADRTGNPATRGNVYFAWSRFTNFQSNIYFVRSTDHGATFSKPKLLTSSDKSLQFADIANIGDGTVTVTWAAELAKGRAKTMLSATRSPATVARRSARPPRSSCSTPTPRRTRTSPVGGRATAEAWATPV